MSGHGKVGKAEGNIKLNRISRPMRISPVTGYKPIKGQNDRREKILD